MKLLHMADIHLGAEPDKGKPWGEGRGKMIWDAFAQAIEAAEEQQVDLVLIAGDLFHRQPLKRELKEVNGILSGLSRAKVVIMAGNHDYLSRNSFYRSFSWNENVSFFQSEQPEAIEFPELNTTVYGFSYEHREIRESRYCNLKKRPGKGLHILLAHGGDDTHIPLKLGQLKELEFDYIALGHIHKPGQLLENKIIMAGALQPLNHTETGPHGYWITELKKGVANTAFYPIRGCEYVEVEIPMERSCTSRQLKQQIQEQVQQLESYQLAKVILTGVYDPEFEPDKEALLEMPGVVEVQMLCRPDYDMQKLKQEYHNQIVGRFIRELEAMPQDEVTRRALYLGIDALMGDSHVY